MIHYGRPGKGRGTAASEQPRTVPSPLQADRQTASQQAAGQVLALGGAMIAGFFLLMTVPQTLEELASGGFPEGAVAVMSTAVQEREAVSVPAETPNEAAGAEPFGYMDGEWNLWEYIGDLMWSLLS